MNFLDLNKEQRLDFIRKQNTNSWDYPKDVCCPYCNAVQDLEPEDVSYEDDGYVPQNCYVCGKGFSVHTSVRYTLTTEVDDEDVYEMMGLSDEG